MDLDARFLSRGFTLVVFDTDYVDKKAFIVLNIPHLSSLMKAAIIEVFGDRVYSVTNPRNVLHFPLPERNFLYTQHSLAYTLDNQYGKFDSFRILKEVNDAIERATTMESNARPMIIQDLEEQAIKLKKKLIKEYGVSWKRIIDKETEPEEEGFEGGSRPASSSDDGIPPSSDICANY
jgi:hypothetical protein